jgi:hypothetical protein
MPVTAGPERITFCDPPDLGDRCVAQPPARILLDQVLGIPFAELPEPDADGGY